jgi:DNA-binding beta-propeller fold protein YncE/mono/diheme cytochrome c family protein
MNSFGRMRRIILAALPALGCIGDADVKTEPWPYPPLEPPPGLSPAMGVDEEPQAAIPCEIAPLSPVPVGQPVTFRAAMGPDPRRFDYVWELEDGVTLAGPVVTHAFKSPQRYIVTLALKSKTSEDMISGCRSMQIVHRPLPPRPPTRCSPIVADGEKARKVWVVNPDANTVAAIDASTLVKTGEYEVGAYPRSLATAPDGALWVVNQDSHDIHVLDAATGERRGRIELPYASQPFCIAFASDGRRGLVTLQALGRVVEVDPAARKLTGRAVDVPAPDGVVPRIRGLSIASDSRRALVTRFVSPAGRGEVFDVSLPADGALSARTITLGVARPEDSHVESPGFPNFMSHVTISNDGHEAWLPGKQDNLERGIAKDDKGNFVRDGKPLTFDTLMRPIVANVDLVAGADAVKRRVDNEQASMPYAAVTSPHGDLLFVSIIGNNQVDIINAYRGDVITVLLTSSAPQGLLLLEDGRIWVQNYLDRSVAVYDVSTILRGLDSVGVTIRRISTVAKEPLTPAQLRGKRIFFNSSDVRMSSRRYVSCIACHLDGEHDGQVWDFTDRGEGLRNTKSLLGVGLPEQGRLHWTANFDEFQDFENDIRRHAFGGNGFMRDDLYERTKNPLGPPKAGLSEELDAMAAFAATLTTIPKSPYRNPDGSLTAAGERGKRAFEKARCGICHDPTRGFTDSKLDDSSPLHDVGTLKATSGFRLEGPLKGLDTPSLRGAWASPPYLHDGTARTLREVLDRKAPALTAALSDAEKNDLAEYLRQID